MIEIWKDFTEWNDQQSEESSHDHTEVDGGRELVFVVVLVEEVGHHQNAGQPEGADHGEENQQCHHCRLIFTLYEAHQEDVQTDKANSDLVDTSFVSLKPIT